MLLSSRPRGEKLRLLSRSRVIHESIQLVSPRVFQVSWPEALHRTATIPDKNLLRCFCHWTIWPWEGPVQAQVVCTSHTTLNQDLHFCGSLGIASRCPTRWLRSNLDQGNVPRFRVPFSVLLEIHVGLHMKAPFQFPLVGWISSLLAQIRYCRSIWISDWVSSWRPTSSWYIGSVLFPPSENWSFDSSNVSGGVESSFVKYWNLWCPQTSWHGTWFAWA